MYYAYRIEHKTPRAWDYGWRTGPGASEIACREDGQELAVSLLRNASPYFLHYRKRILTVHSVNSLPLIQIRTRNCKRRREIKADLL